MISQQPRLAIPLMLLGLAVLPRAGLATEAVETKPPPDLHRSPVFYEIFDAADGDTTNKALLRTGRVNFPPLGVVDLTNFRWARHTRFDKSWWLRMERLEYLLPLIESAEAGDRLLAREWYEGWYEAHKNFAKPNVGSWEGMTSGIRALVLVRYLKREEGREVPDEELVKKLRSSIEDHQRFLVDPGNFEKYSNHGIWCALGLFETTRVVSDPAATALALDRLVEMAETSVSGHGVHLEHAPRYHFHFEDWLYQSVEYIRSLQGWSTDRLAALSSVDSSMQRAGYLLYDHRFNIARIGDSDGPLEHAILARIEHDDPITALFDDEAGYAIFKDDPSSTARRYVVFNIQNASHPPTMPFHYHDDVLAVYYSDDGEIVLGDQGRYDYSGSGRRSFFVSPLAHNTVVHAAEMEATRPRERLLASRVWSKTEENQVTFGAMAFGRAVTREVHIPTVGGSFTVRDRILGDQEYVLLWNIGPDVDVVHREDAATSSGVQERRWLLTTRRNRTFRLALRIVGNAVDDASAVGVVRGQVAPLLGWYSPGYQEMVPSSVITVRVQPRGFVHVTTHLERVQ